jgi:hypothetical protein
MQVSFPSARVVALSAYSSVEGSSSAVFGNLTVYMPGDHENILSMEKFSGMLKSVDCTPQGVTFQFKDRAAFAYAQRVWDWVNGADNHTFVMVVSAGDCGAEKNQHRQPYVVSNIAYDESHDTAYLNATAEDWKAIAHTYDLQVGHVPLPDDIGLWARDISQDLSLPVTTSFPLSISVPIDDFTTSLACSDCGTTGSISFELKVSMAAFVPTDVTIRMAPKGVSAKAQLTLTESGKIQGLKTWDSPPLVTIPLDSITIPGGIVDIGPSLKVTFGIGFSDISGSASITSGVIVNLRDTAVLEIDLLNPSNNQFSGWAPSISPLPLTINSEISGGITAYFEESFDLTAQVLGESASPHPRNFFSLTHVYP